MVANRDSKGGKTYRGPPKPRGSFIDGVWYCECNPPLPAIHFPVKKAGANKGRWFRTCQKEQSDESRCRFFLWDTDAAPRENAALASNPRTVPARANATTPARVKPQRAVSPPSVAPDICASSNSTRKRTRTNYQSDDDDEFDFGDKSATFDEELENIVTAVETPSKRVRMDDAFTTPKRRKLPWQNEPTANTHGLQTPQTESRALADPFTTSKAVDPLVTPSKINPSDAGTMQTLTPSSSPMETPTPSRFKNVTAETDVVRDIFGVLRRANVKLDEQTTRDITAVLSKHVTISEGVKKGRDVARASVKAKDAKITELTYRINTLEAELEAERATVSHLQWKAEHEQDVD